MLENLPDNAFIFQYPLSTVGVLAPDRPAGAKFSAARMPSSTPCPLLTPAQQQVWSRGGSRRYLWKPGHVAGSVDYVNFGQGGELPDF